jgi:ABC-type transport system involved in cytochrome bd biosynthesis fused ATPase/permease subunit
MMKDLIIKLTRFVKPLAPVLALTVFAGFSGFVCAAAIPILCGYGLLSGLGLSGVPISALFAALAACAILRGALRYLEHYTGHYAAFRLLALLRDKVFGAMRRLAPAKMETRDSGDLVSLITSDIELLEVFYAHTVAPVIIAVLFSAGMALFIGSFHPLCGVFAALAYAAAGIALPLTVSRGTGNLGKDYRAAFGAVTTHFLDSIRGVSEIIQFGQGEKRLSEIRRKSKELNKKQGEIRRHENKTASAADALVALFSAGMFILCAFLYQNGMIDMRGVIIPTAAILGSFGAVLAVANLAGSLHGTFAAARRVFALLEEAPEISDIPGASEMTDSGVTARDVSFGYSEKSVLKGINLTVSKGETVGIMGASGCGKSTFLRLLMRFWDVKSGEIRLGGANLKKIPTKTLRASACLLSQDTYIFNATIAENIRIGKPGASGAEVTEAAKKASIHGFITELKDGYQTQAGELGERFSTGERQRIGLARMFLRDAPLLLLDEPTGNIDSLNERTVLRSIEREKQDKTVIIVSHRKSTLTIAGRVCHMEAGKINPGQ